MSHIVQDQEAKIVDLKCLARACRTLGCVLDMEAKTQVYYDGMTNKVDGVIRHATKDKAYQVGLVKNGNSKSFGLAYDDFCGGNGMSEAVGMKCVNLKKEYVKEVLKKSLKEAGHTGVKIRERLLANGCVEITATT